MRSLLLLLAVPLIAAEPTPPPRGNALLADYFERQVAEIENQPLPEPKSAEDWGKMRLEWRKQIADMLGLNPLPPRTPLLPVKTGEVEGDGFVVENIQFQSMPGLYVTANFYRPGKRAAVEERLPAILYVCGHSDVKGKDGTSLGNKTYYQHHGAWFARHGYVCLVIDTVQLGEIRGEHHGTYSQGRWWWYSRGYTPAGAEAWNGIRALDYLESRPEVDRERIGITGRSGGGAYSWWVAAMDDRVKVVAPTAGITTLRNYVVDGAVEGHCDCMFMVNTYRWDYDKVAALVAPRPLLISNTDKDTIFPLNGVVSVYTSVRRHYRALGAENKIGLQISEGPHKDTQPLNAGAFAWFERWLKGADPMALLDEPAKKYLDPEQLRVFPKLPKDEINTKIDVTFVPGMGEVPMPATAEAFEKQREAWMGVLRTQVFGAWPKATPELALRDAGRIEHDGVVLHAWDFVSQEPWTLRLYVIHRAGLEPRDTERVILRTLNDREWDSFAQSVPPAFASLFPENRNSVPGSGLEDFKKRLPEGKSALALFAPRGIGPTAWSGSEKQQTQRLRRFYLLGQTLDGMRVWDIRRAIAAVRAAGYDRPLELRGEGTQAGNVLYASLFEDKIARLDLLSPPTSHVAAPIYLNVLRWLDVPQAVAMASARSHVHVATGNATAWKWAVEAAGKIGRGQSLEVEQPPQLSPADWERVRPVLSR
jgi:dienelactone hydrolase